MLSTFHVGKYGYCHPNPTSIRKSAWLVAGHPNCWPQRASLDAQTSGIRAWRLLAHCNTPKLPKQLSFVWKSDEICGSGSASADLRAIWKESHASHWRLQECLTPGWKGRKGRARRRKRTTRLRLRQDSEFTVRVWPSLWEIHRNTENIRKPEGRTSGTNVSVKTGLASQVLEKFEITRFHGEKVLVATIARMMLKATLRTHGRLGTPWVHGKESSFPEILTSRPLKDGAGTRFPCFSNR